MQLTTRTTVPRSSRRTAIVTMALAALASAFPAAAQTGIDNYNQEKIEFTIDVSEDVEHRTAAFVEPVRGSQFITESKIFPAFTIPCKGEQFDPIITGARGNRSPMVTGGTGAFAGYIGEQKQRFPGSNETGGVNLRVTITLRKASR